MAKICLSTGDSIEMLMQFSFDVSRSAVQLVDSCERLKPNTGGGGGSLKSHVFRVCSDISVISCVYAHLWVTFKPVHKIDFCREYTLSDTAVRTHNPLLGFLAFTSRLFVLVVFLS